MEILESKTIFVDLNLFISDITNLKRVFEDTINPTCTCSNKIKTSSHFCCIVFLNKIMDTDSSLFNQKDSSDTRTFFLGTQCVLTKLLSAC